MGSGGGRGYAEAIGNGKVRVSAEERSMRETNDRGDVDRLYGLVKAQDALTASCHRNARRRESSFDHWDLESCRLGLVRVVNHLEIKSNAGEARGHMSLLEMQKKEMLT